MMALFLACAVWTHEPAGQEYRLTSGDAVLFWTEVEPVRRGEMYLAWGYVPTILANGESVRFCDVYWCNGND